MSVLDWIAYGWGWLRLGLHCLIPRAEHRACGLVTVERGSGITRRALFCDCGRVFYSNTEGIR